MSASATVAITPGVSGATVMPILTSSSAGTVFATPRAPATVASGTGTGVGVGAGVGASASASARAGAGAGAGARHAVESLSSMHVDDESGMAAVAALAEDIAFLASEYPHGLPDDLVSTVARRYDSLSMYNYLGALLGIPPVKLVPGFGHITTLDSQVLDSLLAADDIKGAPSPSCQDTDSATLSGASIGASIGAGVGAGIGAGIGAVDGAGDGVSAAREPSLWDADEVSQPAPPHAKLGDAPPDVVWPDDASIDDIDWETSSDEEEEQRSSNRITGTAVASSVLGPAPASGGPCKQEPVVPFDACAADLQLPQVASLLDVRVQLPGVVLVCGLCVHTMRGEVCALRVHRDALWSCVCVFPRPTRAPSNGASTCLLHVAAGSRRRSAVVRETKVKAKPQHCNFVFVLHAPTAPISGLGYHRSQQRHRQHAK